MIVKKHVSGGRLVLAICDSLLLGKIFEEGEKKLDLSSHFYSGDEIEREDLKKLIKCSYILNIVGEESLEVARQVIEIGDDSVIYIKDIPHAQVLFSSEEVL